MASEKPPKYHVPAAVQIRDAMKKLNSGSKEYQALQERLTAIYKAHSKAHSEAGA